MKQFLGVFCIVVIAVGLGALLANAIGLHGTAKDLTMGAIAGVAAVLSNYLITRNKTTD